MDVLKNLEAILAEAKEAAVVAANEMYEKIGGDRLACGFAWVNIYEYDGKKIRANSRSALIFGTPAVFLSKVSTSRRRVPKPTPRC